MNSAAGRSCQRRAGRIARTAGFCSALVAVTAYAATAPRLTELYRCGDLVEAAELEFCAQVRNPGPGDLRLMLGGEPLGTRDGSDLRFSVDSARHSSGPFWLESDAGRSNAVWLSLQDSATVAAGPGEVAENADGITTYVNLVSIIIEEAFDALPEARRLAEKYEAHVVGGIPPLRVYQLRLSVEDLVHRDALVLRLGGEESVDTVVIEESSAEDAGLDPVSTAAAENELAANRFVDAVDYYRRRIPGPRDARVEPAPLRLGVIERSMDFDAPDFSNLI
ncbi:MAG: peptidase S8 and S53 subtilisin kexin sedolisin, partial [Gammaproteobacteria bacterium]